MENQNKAGIFDDVFARIQSNKAKKDAGFVTSISPPFTRLAERYPGWVKGTYTILTANSGINRI